MNSYLLWIPVLVVSAAGSAWLSSRPNIGFAAAVGYWLWAQLGVGLWLYVAQTSKSLVFDSLLYDIILSMAFVGALVALTTKQQPLGGLQLVGGILALAGLVLMKSQ